MRMIVVIEKDLEWQERIESYLKGMEIRIVKTTDFIQGLEFTKSAIPAIVIMGVNAGDKLAREAIKNLKKDPVTKIVPILVLYNNLDRMEITKDRELGVSDHILKPFNKYALTSKLREILDISEKEKHYQQSTRKSHVQIRYMDNIASITFKTGLKFVLPEVRNLFNAEFIKGLVNKQCYIDIREFNELNKEEVQILVRIVSLFGEKKISIVAGKHLGLILAETDLEEKCNLFVSFEDYVRYLKSPKSEGVA